MNWLKDILELINWLFLPPRGGLVVIRPLVLELSFGSRNMVWFWSFNLHETHYSKFLVVLDQNMVGGSWSHGEDGVFGFSITLVTTLWSICIHLNVVMKGSTINPYSILTYGKTTYIWQKNFYSYTINYHLSI